MKIIIPNEVIERKIFMLRGEKVMLDKDLAKLYGVGTKVLNHNPNTFQVNREAVPALRWTVYLLSPNYFFYNSNSRRKGLHR
jgi:hypothetical protein